MKKYLLLSVILSANYFTGLTQQLSQTSTATFLNNLNQFRQAFGDLNFPRNSAEDVKTDDDIYACSSKLVAIRDSTKSFMSKSVSTLALQGFEFTIPDGATIDSIVVRLRRFKNGRPPIGDYFLSLMQRFESLPNEPSTYGVSWTYLDTYPGKIYPESETEYVFSQGGSGNNGGFNHNEPYQWTPAIVNRVFFGVRIDNFPPVGQGTAEVCYDLVEITVKYSQAAAPAILKSSAIAEAKVLKDPRVYPNPFTTNTNIQFTAAETGSAAVALYNMAGAKVRTLYSGDVVQGHTYNVPVGDALLPNGIYVYRVSNGKQLRTGRIIKIE